MWGDAPMEARTKTQHGGAVFRNLSFLSLLRTPSRQNLKERHVRGGEDYEATGMRKREDGHVE